MTFPWLTESSQYIQKEMHETEVFDSKYNDAFRLLLFTMNTPFGSK